MNTIKKPYEVQVKSLMREFFGDNQDGIFSKASLGVTKIDIELVNNQLFVTVDLLRPGLFIGKHGRVMDSLNEILNRKTEKTVLFKLNEIKDPWY